MSYAGTTRQRPNQCAPDNHDWNPRGDCHRCGIYRDTLIISAIRTVELFKWALTEKQKEKLRKLVK